MLKCFGGLQTCEKNYMTLRLGELSHVSNIDLCESVRIA